MRNMVTGEMFVKSKTSFPGHWKEEHICEAFWKAYENPIKPDEASESAKNTYKRFGVYEGVEVEIFYKKIIRQPGSKNLNLCVVKTFLPSEK